MDSLRLADSAWTADNNWCNPPWSLLPDLVQKLRQSGAPATVIAPHWPDRPWYRDLSELAVDSVLFPPSQGLFYPGRPQLRGRAGPPAWSVVAFRLPSRRGCDYGAAFSTAR